MTNSIRYALLSASILIAAVATALGLFVLHDRRLSDAVAADHLDVIRSAQALVERAQTDQLTVRAQLIASNQAVTGYIVQSLETSLPGTEVDYASVADLLEERRSQLGLALAAVLDADGRIVAITEPLAGRESLGDLPAFLATRETQTARTAVLVDNTRLLGIAIQPLAVYGANEAYLLVGMPVNQAFAESIAKVGAADVAVLMSTPDGPLIAASTLPAAESTRLTEALRAGTGKTDGRFEIDIDGVAHRASLAPLFGDAEARLLAVIPNDSGSAVFGASWLPFFIGIGLALLLLAAALALLWLRVLAPADALARMVEYTAESGDFRVKAPLKGGRAIRRIAEAFNRACERVVSGQKS
ncbi:MAG: hypothetical protein V4673_04805 [Pseudomonadota bacterium]